MNTDNVALSGETLDYGPCAFLDAYDPATVFSSIDHRGRYAYGRQPWIGQWNLSRFAETLLPLLDAVPEAALERAQEVVDAFAGRFHHHWFSGMKAKLGWITDEPEDAERIDRLLELLDERRGDFTNSFRDLSADVLPAGDPAFGDWFEDWRARIARQPLEKPEILVRMRARNPAVIPRNHKVEEALEAASQRDDFGPLHRLLAALADPYGSSGDLAGYQEPAPPGGPAYRTFCGT